VKVGEKLTIKGKNFRPGKGKTKVFFSRAKGKGFGTAAAESATRTRVVVIVPTTLNDPLAGKRARFRVRILAKRFGKWSKLSVSPLIAPSATTNGGGSGSTAPDADCDLDGQSNAVDTDDDNDLLPDTQETSIATLPCNGDTDGDGAQDGFEYQSALDLNRTVLHGTRPPTPYPGKRPYPNALFPDSNTDFDGDGLTELDEHALWLRYGNHAFPLNYSAGLQTSVPTPLPPNPELEQLDSAAFGGHAFDGQLDDGERDADDDGLSNWDESHGRMTPDWWPSTYNGKGGTKKETPYTVHYAATDLVDPDVDGDGIVDGADDQDFDGLPNTFEVARPWNWDATYVSVGPNGLTHPGTNSWARVDPFNPCKPVFSETCHNHPPFNYYADDEDWQGPSIADAIAADGVPGAQPGPLHP
jgi:hypothetical protein